MTVRVGLLVEAERSNVPRTLDEIDRRLREIGNEAASATGKTRQLGPAIGVVAGQGRSLGDVAKQTRGVGQESEIAAGSVGNLFAQFNDIGVMMAAGQNPLQLAIQQGTQISQVLGPLGAGQAVRALGSAFLSLLSPINLLTIGGIALGATAFNWLTSVEEDAKDAKDGMEALAEATDRYAQAVKASREPISGTNVILRELTQGVRELQDLRAGILEQNALGALAGQVQALRTGDAAAIFQDAATFSAEVRTGFNSGSVNQRTGQRKIRRNRAEEFGIEREQAGELLRALDALAQAEIPDDLIRSGAELADVLERVFGEAENMPKALRDVALTAAELSEQALSLEQTAADARVGLFDRMMAAVDQYGERWSGVADLIAEGQLRREEQQAAEEARQNEAFTRRITAALDAVEAGETLLAGLRQQADIQQLIAEYGEDSIEVARARADAERAAFEELVASLNVSESLKDELFDAWDAANGLASVDIAGNIGAAVGNARALAAELGVALSVASQIMAARQAAGTDAPIIYDPRDPNYDPVRAEFGRLQLNRVSRPSTTRSNRGRRGGGGSRGRGGRGRGGGSGTSEIDREREAVEKLITSLEEEVEILREIDPIQKEMIRLRDRLGAATDDERSKIEDLIRTREEEKKAIEANQDAYDLAKDAFGDFVSSMDGTLDGAIQAAGELANKILEAVAAAYLLGDGPLAGALGTAGTGGVIGRILGPLFPGVERADGGMIYGPGGPREDRVPVWASNGEFMVNAEATARHRPLLEMINNGMDIPGFRDGGMIGRAPAAGASPFGMGDVIIEDHTSSPKTFERRETIGPGGRRQQRIIMADAVGDAMTVPGGGAQRTLQSTYGVSQVRPRR